MRRPGLLVASVGTAVLGVALLRLWDVLHRDQPPPGHRQAAVPNFELPAELLRQRLLLPRLVGGFQYAAYGGEPDTSSRRILRGPAPGTLLQIQRQVESAIGVGEHDSAALNAEAILLLSTDVSPDRLRRALTSLEAAHASEPHDSAALNNLSAVRFALAESRDQPLGVLGALAAIEAALRLVPSLPEALFNRALYLERLGLWHEAKQAWETYLQQDHGSAWADEAREHLRNLAPGSARIDWEAVEPELLALAAAGDQDGVASLIDRLRSQARRHLEEVLLPRWGEAHLAGRVEEARRDLSASLALAGALRQLTSDRLYIESVSVILAAQEGDAGEPALRLLAAGHRGFRRGTEALQRANIEEAHRHLSDAVAAFETADSPFAARAAFKRAICEQRLHRYAAAQQRFRSLIHLSRRAGYSNLEAESLWMEGLLQVEQANPGAGAAAYAAALPLFEAMEDQESVAGIHTLLGERLLIVGDVDRAWRHVGAALTLGRWIDNPRRIHQMYVIAAYGAATTGHPDIALLFQEVTVEAARRAGDPFATAGALRWRAHFHGLAGHLEEASRDLGEARRLLEAIPGQASRREAEAGVAMVESELLGAADPEAAIEKLGATADFYRRSGYRVRLVPVLLALGRAHVALEDDEAARPLLADALTMSEETRGQLRDEMERIAFFGLVQEAFDELAALEIRRGDFEAALATVERGRARALLDWLDRGEMAPAEASAASQTLDLAALTGAVPADRVIIEYAMIGDSLVAWVIRRGAIHLRTLTSDLEAVKREVRTLRTRLERPTTSPVRTRAAGETLHEVLIQPLADLLPAGACLVLVPDGFLYEVPFAALWDEQRGRYLVEQRCLTSAPSLSLYARALARDRLPPGTQNLRALVVGDPAIDPRATGLPRLRAAAAEAQEVARLYGVEPLVGPEATKDRFLAEADEQDILHFAGHALASPGSPWSSRLLFAASSEQKGAEALTAEELYGRGFSATRLVFLSACSTAGGPFIESEGVANLARPFLAAGVPAVVATLWPIEDRPASDLVVAFHREIRAGRDAAHALQAAQVAALHSARDAAQMPASWASFLLIGEASFRAPTPPPRKEQKP